MEVVTKQITFKISKEEQTKLLKICDYINDSNLCNAVDCMQCIDGICQKGVCPFHELDDELMEIRDKIAKVAMELGPKE